MKNGRCRKHGGKTPAGIASPNFKNGEYSKYMYLPPMMTSRIEQMTLDIIENLESAIKIQAAFETRLHEQFTDGVSLEKWRELRAILEQSDNDDLEGPGADYYLAIIKEIVALGLQDARNEEILSGRLRVCHESQRKLSESASKIRKEQQETYTQEQWNMIQSIQLRILQKILEPKQLQMYIDEVAVYQRKELKA